MEHQLWRKEKYRESPREVKRQGAVDEHRQDVEDEPDPDHGLERSENNIPCSLGEEWEARLDNVVDWVIAGNF